MRQNVMSIHAKNGATVTTPARFAIASRCARLKRELKANRNTGFKRWGE